MNIILETLWFFLPAMAANIMPVFAARYNWLPALARPIDAGKTWRGQRILGDHKTWRGLAVGVLFGAIMAFSVNLPVVAGAALGLGALVGDAIKSFFKRQLAIAPGASWPIADQIDFVIGAGLVGSLFLPITFVHVLIAIVVIGVGSFVTSYIGVKLNIKKEM